MTITDVRHDESMLDRPPERSARPIADGSTEKPLSVAAQLTFGVGSVVAAITLLWGATSPSPGVPVSDVSATTFPNALSVGGSPLGR